jgi:small subunit ribosomal protein S20
MPNIKSAGKRAKQAEVRRVANRSAKSSVATTRRIFMEAIESKDKEKVMLAFRAFCSILDKTAKRGILTKNSADRRKSRASAMVAKVV